VLDPRFDQQRLQLRSRGRPGQPWSEHAAQQRILEAEIPLIHHLVQDDDRLLRFDPGHRQRLAGEHAVEHRLGLMHQQQPRLDPGGGGRDCQRTAFADQAVDVGVNVRQLAGR
jgi:hypothetical protein